MGVLNPVTVGFPNSTGYTGFVTTTNPLPVSGGVEITATPPTFDPNTLSTMTEPQLLRAILAVQMATQQNLNDRLDSILSELKVIALMEASAFDLYDGPEGFRE